MPTAIRKSRVRDDYLALIKRFSLRPIRGKKEYNEASAILDELAVRDEGTLSPGEQDYFDALTTFIGLYDKSHYPAVPSVSPHALLQGLMENRGMTVTQLDTLFNSKGVASEILSGKRPMTLKIIQKLAKHFRVPAASFLPT